MLERDSQPAREPTEQCRSGRDGEPLDSEGTAVAQAREGPAPAHSCEGGGPSTHVPSTHATREGPAPEGGGPSAQSSSWRSKPCTTSQDAGERGALKLKRNSYIASQAAKDDDALGHSRCAVQIEGRKEVVCCLKEAHKYGGNSSAEFGHLVAPYDRGLRVQAKARATAPSGWASVAFGSVAEVSHRCSGFKPLWVHGAHPDKSNGNRVAAQPAGAAPKPPRNDIDAPRDQPSNRAGSHLVHTHS